MSISGSCHRSSIEVRKGATLPAQRLRLSQCTCCVKLLFCSLLQLRPPYGHFQTALWRIWVQEEGKSVRKRCVQVIPSVQVQVFCLRGNALQTAQVRIVVVGLDNSGLDLGTDKDSKLFKVNRHQQTLVMSCNVM